MLIKYIKFLQLIIYSFKVYSCIPKVIEMFDETIIINKVCVGLDVYVMEESACDFAFLPFMGVEINNRDDEDKIIIKSYDESRKDVTPVKWINIFNAVKTYMEMRDYRITEFSFDSMKMKIFFEFDEE